MLSITNDHNEEDAYKKCVRPIERSLACVNLLEYKKEYESITANGGGGNHLNTTEPSVGDFVNFLVTQPQSSDPYSPVPLHPYPPKSRSLYTPVSMSI